MAITDKTRKILWGRSGNRCAICRHELVVDRTAEDKESVVGDECHIVSEAPNGPRHDPLVASESIDDLSNLLLLCRVHHKMVDDQHETYTTQILKSIKSNHEKWVEEKLRDTEEASPIRMRRVKSEIPTHLTSIDSGKDLFSIATGCSGYYQNYSDDLSDDEIELVGSFLQNLQDWVDIADSLEPIEKMRAAKSMDDDLMSLVSSGFRAFFAVENQRLEGGVGGASNFKVLHISVLRLTDPSIVSPVQAQPTQSS